MPEVPEEIFIEGMRQLIAVDSNWIPAKKDHSLYIRPFMFATDEILGVKPSTTYKFLIILSPTGPYYARPMRIAVEERYTRASPGGVGFAKNAGNYGGSLLAATLAQKEGYDQVLWTDAFEHKWLQEVGMMNVFFVIDNVAITPSLEEETILNGVTRNSVVTILKEMGVKVEERKINIDEVIKAHKEDKLQEIFGTGTAATIAMIQKLKYRDYVMEFNESNWALSSAIKQKMNDIRERKVPDIYNWLVTV